MPLMNGVELVNAALKLNQPPNLIVVMTSRCDMPKIKKQLSSSRVHLFNKPFSPLALANLIEELAKNKIAEII